MAELIFFTGTMDCGKSTLALQIDHNARQRGLSGRIYTCHDRAGRSTLSSRLGLTAPAVEVVPDLDLWDDVVAVLTHQRVDYAVCDEAQFYTADQVDQLARIVDELGVDVYAFGILTDFRTTLFAGSRRLVELADRTETLQVRALCWCGRPGTHNARIVDGDMVTEGEQLVFGDTGDREAAGGRVGYEVLCRRHHRRRVTTRAAAGGAPASSPTLPFGSGSGRRQDRPEDGEDRALRVTDPREPPVG